MTEIQDLTNLNYGITSHSLRSGKITQLKKSGISDRDIIRETGHKNVMSLDSYDKNTGKMSHAYENATFGILNSVESMQNKRIIKSNIKEERPQKKQKVCQNINNYFFITNDYKLNEIQKLIGKINVSFFFFV